MTITLEAMLRRASKNAEKMFNKFGGIEMHWLVDTPDESQGLVITPIRRETDEDEFAAAVREQFEAKNVTRFVLVSTAWAIPDEYDDGHGSIEQMPGRIEVLLLMASDGRERLSAMREIVRPAGGKPYLTSLKIDRKTEFRVQIRFANMLPVENATRH
jgi:hypothetical protein